MTQRRVSTLVSATSDLVLWCHYWPEVYEETGFETLASWQEIEVSCSPLQSVHKKRIKKWPLHRIPCIVLASFLFSLSVDTLESFWKLHLLYSKGHSNENSCTIAISILGQALQFQSLWAFFFFINCIAVNEKYRCSRLCIKLYRN